MIATNKPYHFILYQCKCKLNNNMYFPGFAVTATGLSYDTIEVTWQPLDPELADITSGYSVEWYFQAIPVSTYMTSIGVFLHHIPDLDPYTNYTIRVSPVTKDGLEIVTGSAKARTLAPGMWAMNRNRVLEIVIMKILTS